MIIKFDKVVIPISSVFVSSKHRQPNKWHKLNSIPFWNSISSSLSSPSPSSRTYFLVVRHKLRSQQQQIDLFKKGTRKKNVSTTTAFQYRSPRILLNLSSFRSISVERKCFCLRLDYAGGENKKKKSTIWIVRAVENFMRGKRNFYVRTRSLNTFSRTNKIHSSPLVASIT